MMNISWEKRDFTLVYKRKIGITLGEKLGKEVKEREGDEEHIESYSKRKIK